MRFPSRNLLGDLLQENDSKIVFDHISRTYIRWSGSFWYCHVLSVWPGPGGICVPVAERAPWWCFVQHSSTESLWFQGSWARVWVSRGGALGHSWDWRFSDWTQATSPCSNHTGVPMSDKTRDGLSLQTPSTPFRIVSISKDCQMNTLVAT